jgi:hypothetical protein
MKYACGNFSASFAFIVKLTVMYYFSGLLQKERTLSTVFAITLFSLEDPPLFACCGVRGY